VAELADALDLGSSGATRAGSIPVIRILNLIILIGIPTEKRPEHACSGRCAFWL
tara:strand:- start:146 stop:307 length:162 start_codon:yes stop_codon:yes gene_type:complete